MTTRNLNKTKITILVEQYTADHAADRPHPIRYLLHDHKFRKDIFWEIPQRIDPQVFKRELCVYIRNRGDRIEYESELFRAYPRSSSGGGGGGEKDGNELGDDGDDDTRVEEE